MISNRAARRLLLASQGLSDDPTRRLDDAGLLDLIERMGFVQIDSIRTVERAHHHILFSRNQNYRREQLVRLIDGEASLFENWTHDAAIIPSRFYPFWRSSPTTTSWPITLKARARLRTGCAAFCAPGRGRAG